MRNVAAIVAGVIIAFATVLLIDKINHMIYPPPQGLDFTDPDAIRPYLATLPVGAFLLILASSVVAAFVGTMLACYIGTASPATLIGIVLSTLAAMRLAPSTEPAAVEINDRDGDPG